MRIVLKIEKLRWIYLNLLKQFSFHMRVILQFPSPGSPSSCRKPCPRSSFITILHVTIYHGKVMITPRPVTTLTQIRIYKINLHKQWDRILFSFIGTSTWKSQLTSHCLQIHFKVFDRTEQFHLLKQFLYLVVSFSPQV